MGRSSTNKRGSYPVVLSLSGELVTDLAERAAASNRGTSVRESDSAGAASMSRMQVASANDAHGASSEQSISRRPLVDEVITSHIAKSKSADLSGRHHIEHGAVFASGVSLTIPISASIRFRCQLNSAEVGPEQLFASQVNPHARAPPA